MRRTALIVEDPRSIRGGRGFAFQPGVTFDPPLGISVQSLEPGSELTIRTRNSEYHLVVLDGEDRRVIARGGVLPRPTPACLEGANAGGGVVKDGWIGLGLRVEMSIGAKRLVTSPVESVTVDSARDLEPDDDSEPRQAEPAEVHH